MLNLVEPQKWGITTTATPSRGSLRYAIKSGGPTFTDGSIEALATLIRAGLRIGTDTSAYSPNLVAHGIVGFIKRERMGRL